MNLKLVLLNISLSSLVSNPRFLLIIWATKSKNTKHPVPAVKAIWTPSLCNSKPFPSGPLMMYLSPGFRPWTDVDNPLGY